MTIDLLGDPEAARTRTLKELVCRPERVRNTK